MTTIAGFSLYGGATITRVFDGAGHEWIGCCGKDSAGVFGFRAFRDHVHVPLTPFCSGRGSISNGGKWIAWEGAVFFGGDLPGFVAVAAGQGPQGDPGPPGATGPQGPQGEPGSGGAALTAADREAIDRLKIWLGIVG